MEKVTQKKSTKNNKVTEPNQAEFTASEIGTEKVDDIKNPVKNKKTRVFNSHGDTDKSMAHDKRAQKKEAREKKKLRLAQMRTERKQRKQRKWLSKRKILEKILDKLEEFKYDELTKELNGRIDDILNEYNARYESLSDAVRDLNKSVKQSNEKTEEFKYGELTEKLIRCIDILDEYNERYVFLSDAVRDLNKSVKQSNEKTEEILSYDKKILLIVERLSNDLQPCKPATEALESSDKNTQAYNTLSVS